MTETRVSVLIVVVLTLPLFYTVGRTETPPAGALPSACPDDTFGSASSPSPVSFTENRGQAPDRAIRFQCSGGVPAYFRDDCVIFRVDGERRMEGPDGLPAGQRGPAGADFAVYRLVFDGAAPVAPRGFDRLPFDCNYFFGNDPGGWARGVPNYRGIIYENLYDGIDLRFFAAGGALKYEFYVRSGADIGQIGIRYEGARLSLDRDGLLIETPVAAVRDGHFRAFQPVDGREMPVRAGMLVDGDRLGFRAEYDSRLPLVIDPLIYSTLLGCDYVDTPHAIAVDDSGCAYLAGDATSGFPTTPGVYKPQALNGGIFVTKLDAAGASLVYSTFLVGTTGGWSSDVPNGIAVDSSGCAFITGFTESPTFPTTSGAYDQTPALRDAFVTKLSADGSSLIYSTVLGGTSDPYGQGDLAVGICIERSGAAVIGGTTYTADFPTTANAVDRTLGGASDGFVAKFSADGSRLLFSTYIGGSGTDSMADVALDDRGDVAATGTTGSSDMPVTQGAYQNLYRGICDAFAVELNASGDSILACTYLGGSDQDYGHAVGVDGSGNVHVAGSTSSTNFPSTAGAFHGPCVYGTDAFVLKLGPRMGSLLWSGCSGGTGYDDCRSLAVDFGGNVVATGRTDGGFPTTADALQTKFNGYHTDPYLLKLDSKGAMVYSTYFGGSGNDYWEWGEDVALDPSGYFYATGMADSSDFPTTEGAYDASYNHAGDVFAAKMLVGKAPSAPQNLTIISGDRFLNLSWKLPASDGYLPILNYAIYYGKSPDALGLLTRLPPGRTWYNHSSLQNGVNCSYALSATNILGESPRSATASAMPGVPPSPPRSLAGAGLNHSVGLDWLDPAQKYGMPVLGYRIYRSYGGGKPVVIGESAQGLAYTDDLVSNGINYSYCVTARNIIGESAPSATVWVIPSGYPSAPAMLSGRFVEAQMLVRLEWQPPGDNGGTPVVRYIAYRGEGEGATVIAETGELSLDDADISVGMVCVYSVSAVNHRGEGERAGPVSVPVGFPPGAPQDIRCVEEDRSLVLEWNPPAERGGFPVTGYRVYRVNDANRTTLLAETRETSWRDTGLANGAVYRYRLTAQNLLGEGGPGNASGIPHALPSAPPDLEAGIAGNRVVLSWGAPADDGGGHLSGYNVYVKTGGDFALLGSFEGRTAGDTIGARQFRVYKVTALTEYGEGPASNEATAALPRADFTFSPQRGNMTTRFSFESTAYDPDGTIVSWSWSFGDGQVATGPRVNHTFPRHQRYNVVLKVRDNSGGEADGSLVVNISNRAPYLRSGKPAASLVDVALGAELRLSAEAADDDNDTLSYCWTIDGLPAGEGRECLFKARSMGKHLVDVKVSDGEAGVTRQWSVVVTEPPKSDLGPILPIIAVAAVIAAGVAAGLVLRKRRKKGS